MQALAARLISRLPHSRPGRLIVGAGLVLALLTIGVAAGAAVIDGTSDPAGPPATEVPADQVDAIARAALSCPTLTAARLAGQLMAASGFRLDATTPAGGSGVAGLTDAQWATWVPWTGAVRHDPAAETTALAHLMCSLAGQVREQGLAGDLWEPTLGAYRAGVAAVATAHGVPGSAADYVHTVTGYAAWYASHDPGTPSQPASPAPVPTGSATAPKPVPGDLVQLVVSAGRECPQITAARIAGQLMAASGFESDLRGTDGGQGIAQFLPTLWSRYAGAGQSPFAPATAIPTLGTAMCSLTSALNGLTDDPYPIALASFKDGPQISAPETTAGAGGDHFADQVVAYSAYYARDPRLAVAPASSSPAAGAAAGNTGANPAGATTDPVAAAPAAPGTPAAGSAATGPAKAATSTAKGTTSTKGTTPTYAIQVFGARCITVPTAADGTQLEIRTCSGAGNQKWATGSDGTLRSRGLCMDLAWGSSDNGTAVQVAACNGGSAQHFYVNSSNDLVNADLGKCVDVVDNANTNGARLQLWDCTGATNQKWTKI
jgi:hypothetical protein